MAVYVRALLEDVIHGKSDPVTKVDLTMAIDVLLATKQLTPLHIQLMRKHLQGYSPTEIYPISGRIEPMLTQAYALIAEQSGYTDEQLLQRGVNMFPQYGKILPALRERALILGRNLHDPLD
jgi:hypothetical protein